MGGVASGKSLVARQLEACGARVLDGDRAGHEVLTEEDVEQAIRQRWGEKVFGADGHVDRKAVAGIVFAPPPHGPPELDFLERLTHPRIKALLAEEVATASARGLPAAVLDAPVMFKAGWNQWCDKIVYVDAPREARLARALARGWTAAEFARREAAQPPLAAQRERADVVIDNSGSPETTRMQVERFWKDLLKTC